MEEKNKHILQQFIEKLPQTKAPAKIWDNIEAELENDNYENNRQHFKRAIHHLPNTKTPDIVWENIHQQLNHTSLLRLTIGNYLKIAASIALLMAFAFLMQHILHTNSNNELLSFSEEIMEDNLSETVLLNIDSEFNKVLEKQCAIQPDVCENPQFTELNKELEDLTKSLVQLKTQSENADNDPETYKYILRIEKEKAEITKKLIQQFNS